MVAEAANLIYALSWKNLGNKALLASRGCCEALFNSMISLENAKSDDELFCYEKLGYALSSLMIYFTNQERLFSECIINYNY